jgi:hypothetical protein
MGSYAGPSPAGRINLLGETSRRNCHFKPKFSSIKNNCGYLPAEKQLRGNTQIRDSARRRSCLRVNKSHIEVWKLPRCVRLHNVIDGALVPVNQCATFGKVLTSNFKVFDVMVTVVLQGKISFHDAPEATFSPSVVKFKLRQRNGLGVHCR